MSAGFFFKLPEAVQGIALFAGCFLLLFVGLLICRIIGIKSYGSEREYFKYFQNPLSYKKIWLFSLSVSIIVVLFFALKGSVGR